MAAAAARTSLDFIQFKNVVSCLDAHLNLPSKKTTKFTTFQKKWRVRLGKQVPCCSRYNHVDITYAEIPVHILVVLSVEPPLSWRRALTMSMRLISASPL